MFVVLEGFDLPCTEDAPTCLETCGRVRQCGRHRCMEHCHVGPCSTVYMPVITDLWLVLNWLKCAASAAITSRL